MAGAEAAGACLPAAGLLYSPVMIVSISCEVSPPGQHGGPPGSLIPISMCGAEEIPTEPQPTSAIGCPVTTWVPTGTSAGAA